MYFVILSPKSIMIEMATIQRYTCIATGVNSDSNYNMNRLISQQNITPVATRCQVTSAIACSQQLAMSRPVHNEWRFCRNAQCDID